MPSIPINNSIPTLDISNRPNIDSGAVPNNGVTTAATQIPGGFGAAATGVGTVGTAGALTANNTFAAVSQTGASLGLGLGAAAQTAANAREQLNAQGNNILLSQQRVQQNNLNTQNTLTNNAIQNAAARDAQTGYTANAVYDMGAKVLADQQTKAKGVAEAFKN